MKNKKELIMKFLGKNGVSSTGKIANEIKSNQWKTKEYLEELKKEKKVDELRTPNSIYWSIKK